jgi:hypothetical protein
LWSSDVEGRRRRCVELGGSAIRAWMERVDARTGTVVWRRCSRAAFIGRGTIGGGRSRSNRRRLSGTSMAKPFRLGEEIGRGNRESGRRTKQRRRFVLPRERKGCCTGDKKTAGPTDRVGPPISEGEATGRMGRKGREEMGRGWAGKEGRSPGRNCCSAEIQKSKKINFN